MLTLHQLARLRDTSELEIIRRAYEGYHGISDMACIQAEYEKLLAGGTLPHYMISYLIKCGFESP